MVIEEQAPTLFTVSNDIILGNSGLEFSIFMQHDYGPDVEKIHGLDIHETLFDLLIKYCKHLHWNPSKYTFLIPELNTLKSINWKIPPLTSRIDKWAGCISYLCCQSFKGIAHSPNDIFIRIVLKTNVHKFIGRSMCLSSKFAGLPPPASLRKTGREYLKEFGTRILLTLPGNIITVVREKEGTSVFTIVEKACKEKCFSMSKLSVYNPKTGHLLDPNLSFDAQGVVEMELKFCVPSNLIPTSSTELVRAISCRTYQDSPTSGFITSTRSSMCSTSNPSSSFKLLSKPTKRRAPPPPIPPPQTPAMPARDYPVSPSNSSTEALTLHSLTGSKCIDDDCQGSLTLNEGSTKSQDHFEPLISDTDSIDVQPTKLEEFPDIEINSQASNACNILGITTDANEAINYSTNPEYSRPPSPTNDNSYTSSKYEETSIKLSPVHTEVDTPTKPPEVRKSEFIPTVDDLKAMLDILKPIRTYPQETVAVLDNTHLTYNTVPIANSGESDRSRHRWNGRFWDRSHGKHALTFLIQKDPKPSASSLKSPISSSRSSPCETFIS